MLPSNLKSLIEKYCTGTMPTDAQIDEIMDLAISLSADSSEVAQYIEKMQQGPTKEERDAIAKAEAERKAKEEAKRKAEAERKAKEEAERKAKEEAERKAKEEAELKAKQKTMEVQVTGLSTFSDSLFKDCTFIKVDCKPENNELRIIDVELVLIDILTDKRYTVSRRIPHNFSLGGFGIVINNNSLPSKFKCQAIVRWKGNVIAMSEFYELDRK